MDRFLWGVATSAFQIEGHLQNDMTHWEKLGRFSEDGHEVKYEDAVSHWCKWQNDFLLLQQLRVNAYRFSMDWGRIQPAPNCFDEKALTRYDKMVDRLLELAIEPMLTLHHFTHPVWFHEKTPWHETAAIEAFAQFARKLAERFGDRIRLFVTLNEPIVWALAAYGDGKFPPGQNDLGLMMKAIHNMLRAHRVSYECIKEKNRNASVGIAKNFIVFRPDRFWSLVDRGLVQFAHTFYNLMLLKAFRSNRLRSHFPFLLHYDQPIDLDDKIDFWGMNYYYRMHLRFKLDTKRPFSMKFKDKSGEGLSDMGWEIYSRGLRDVLDWLRFTEKPVFITENGIADGRDQRRLTFLANHLKIIEQARGAGFPIKGYFHWSLMDNYEWLEGQRARFGLYRVDYENHLKRELRQSGRFYAEYVAEQLADNI